MAKEVLLVPRAKRLDVAYDEEADVLYLSFGPAKPADDGLLLDNDVILRYRRAELIGITVLGLKQRFRGQVSA